MIKNKMLTKISKSFSSDEHIFEKANWKIFTPSLKQPINKYNKEKKSIL